MVQNLRKLDQSLADDVSAATDVRAFKFTVFAVLCLSADSSVVTAL